MLQQLSEPRLSPPPWGPLVSLSTPGSVRGRHPGRVRGAGWLQGRRALLEEGMEPGLLSWPLGETLGQVRGNAQVRGSWDLSGAFTWRHTHTHREERLFIMVKGLNKLKNYVCMFSLLA